MRVRIDNDKCQGHGRCYALAATVFGEDDEGYGTVLITDELNPEQLDLARLAEANCPEGAIVFEQAT